jgi:hypothetical protein
MSLWLHTLRLRATAWSDRVDNTLDNSQEEIGQPFIIHYPLYMLIIHVYYDFGRMPDFGRKIWLESYISTPDALLDFFMSRLWSYLLISVAHHNSDRLVCNMSYHLSCERFRMIGLYDCSILQLGYLVKSRLGGMHNSISIQNLNISRLHMLK